MKSKDLKEIGYESTDGFEWINLDKGLLYDKRLKELFYWTEVDNSTEPICKIKTFEQLEELTFLL